MSHTLHVVSHTHWDREWYLTYEQFRLRLVDLVDHLLDLMENEPDFKYFNLDGQGIILEDYLAIRPENEERLRKLIQEGRITIGPWYVLNDEFLVSGESTVRSLLLGHKVVRAFGPVMKVGYLPDQFGNISQMPQILRNFGIDNCIFGRGWQVLGDRKMEFDWVAPDGSRVLSSLMNFWYNNAQDIPADEEAGRRWVEDMAGRMKAISGSGHLLFMNGVDHLEPQYSLPEALAHINPVIEDSLIHSRLTDYVDALRQEAASGALKPGEYAGELREDRWSSILSGVLSARIYLKQANERCMRVLEKYAEPASAWASLIPIPSDSPKAKAGAGAGFRYPSGELEYAWKLLMQNHPHDSICGCSTDEVHDEMVPRFMRVEQLGSQLADRAMRYIADRVDVDDMALVVFNTLTWERNDVVRASVDIPLGEPDRFNPPKDAAKDWPALEILDENGDSVPYTLISADIVTRNVLHPEKLPHVQYVKRFQVEFVAQGVPAMGYKTYRVARAEQTPDFGPGVAENQAGAEFLATGELHLAPSGSQAGLDLTTLFGEDGSELEEYFSELSSFEDVGDVGDEYNYRKPDRDIRVTSWGALRGSRVIANGPVSGEIQFDYELRVPESATPCQKTRSEKTVNLPISLRAKMYRGVRRVEFEAQFDNNAKDHRLRAIFPTYRSADGSVAGSAFDVVKRALRLPEDWMATRPLPSTFHPMDGWVDVSTAEEGGLAVLVDGLREYELYPDESGSLAITLVRSVGVLSGGDHIPHVQYTPGAQCQGRNVVRYAVYPHAGDWKEGKVWKQSLEFNTPLVAVQVGDLERKRSIETRPKNLATSYSLLSIDTDWFVPSALKKAETGSNAVLRFWNISDEEQSGTVSFPGAKRCWRSNMAEEQLEELPMDMEQVKVTARSREIVTLVFEL